MEYLLAFKDWVFGLGERYHVDPLVFGCLYLVSKLFFFSFLGWAIKNLRRKISFTMPLALAGCSFSIPYLYVIIAGRNIPFWVYLCIVALFVYGAFSIYKRIRIMRV